MTATSTFDGDAIQLDAGTPIAKVGGRTYRGRILSFREWAKYEDVVAKLDAQGEELAKNGKHRLFDEGYDADFRLFARDYLYQIFPRPPWWAFWRRDPVPEMLAHPALTRCVRLFFGVQARAIAVMSGASLDAPNQETPGQSSPSSTAEAPPAS